MNILMDKLPTEYQGYKINTDFRIGIKLCNLFEDADLEEEDKIDDAIDILWGAGVPTCLSHDGSFIVDYNLVVETIQWFLSGGNDSANQQDKQKEQAISSKDIAYDFSIDADYIFAAYYQQYHIDLSEVDMHWFKFLALFKALKDTVFNRIQEIRTQDLSDIPAGKARAEAQQQKDNFRIVKATPERKKELMAVFGNEWKEHL